MRCLDPGHVYELAELDGSEIQCLAFVNREPGREAPGTQNQELLRVLIDRVQYLDARLPWPGNARIIHHLRMALALHEARVIERKTECGKIAPEAIATGADGHFLLGNHSGPTTPTERR